MIETAVEFRARTLAEVWHADQLDKTGAPYVGHLRRVATGAAHLILSDSALGAHSHGRRRTAAHAAAAGWIHDLLEDTDCPWKHLSATVPADVTVAVMALTHADGEPWVDYISRIADERQLAPWVKWADIQDNSDPERLDLVREYQPETWKRMVVNLPVRIEQFARVMEARRIDGPWRAAA